jgi:type VI secretion system secreted protein VgrG
VAEKGVRTSLEVRAGSLSESDVVVEQVFGLEGLSSPFKFSMSFRPAGTEALELKNLVGASSLLTIRRPEGEERKIHGLLRSVVLAGISAARPRYVAELVPRFALLDQSRNSRIFQNKTVPDIVKSVLDALNVPFRLTLGTNYPKREFCVQYAESDLAFVSRLLEDEGIFYFFEHADDRDTIVFADAPSACIAIPGDASLPFRDADVARDEQSDEHVFAVERTDRQRPGKVTLRDFDFAHPDLDLTASNEFAGSAAHEFYEHPGGYSGPMVGKRRAKARLEELRVLDRGFDGRSSCLRFAAGSTFDLSEHPDDAFNTTLLLLRVVHEARQESRVGSGTAIESGYHNRFVAALARAPYRPSRRTRQPRMVGTQTALVVGAGGEEIDTDSHGRIKIQFHWDREGKNDDSSSCFLRVVQGWAGPGLGKSVVPRVGQEVVVRFLNGDPDRPLVVGAVFNGANGVPLALPSVRSQATFRTDSSTGSGGANEVLFEDEKGKELFSVHAQRQEHIEVIHDKRQVVASDEALNVGKNRSLSISGDQSLRVASDDTGAVRQSQSLTIAGDRRNQVIGDHDESTGLVHSLSVAASRNRLVGGNSGETVGADAALTVGAFNAVNVATESSTGVGGTLSRQVGANFVEIVAGIHEETVAGDLGTKVAGDDLQQAEGDATYGTGKDVDGSVDGKSEFTIAEPLGLIAKSIELEADTLTLIVGGNLAWQMKQSGNVTVGANTMTLNASGSISMKGSSIKKDASDSADQQSLELKNLDDLRKSTASARVAAKGADGVPLANLKFKAELPDGSTHEGKTDGAGNASIPVSKEGEVKLSFPDLDAGAWKTE